MTLVIQAQKLRNHVNLLQDIVDKHEQSVLSVPVCGLEGIENIEAYLTAKNALFQSHSDFKEPKVGMGFGGTNSSVDLSSKTISDHMMSDPFPDIHDQLIGSRNSQQPEKYLCPPTLISPARQIDSQSRCAEPPFGQRMTDMGMEFVLAYVGFLHHASLFVS